MESTPQPRHFQPGEGKGFKVGRMTMTFKTTASQDWNAYSVCEAIEPPESGAGLHRHPTGIFDAMIAEVRMLDTGSPTRQGSEEARANATNCGLELLPS